MWISASGGGRISTGGLVAALVALTAAAAAVFLVLPAPVVASRVAFLARAGLGGAVGVPGDLAGDAGSPAQLSKAGSPDGPIRVGGYLGFAQSLDTALRGQLGNQLVMQVRADRPSYWVGETFDTWQGASWSQAVVPPNCCEGARRSCCCPPRTRLPSANPTSRPSTSPVPPPTSSSMRTVPRSVVPVVEPLHLRGRHHRLAPRPGERVDLHGGVEREHAHPRAAADRLQPADAAPGDPGGVRTAAALVPPGPGAGPVRDAGRRVDLRQGASRSSTGSAPTPATPPTSPRCRPARTPSTSSSSATGWAIASRSRRRWR